MKILLFISLVLCMISVANPAAAQKATGIIGDTIYVFKGSQTTLQFPRTSDISDLNIANKNAYTSEIRDENKLLLNAGTKPENSILTLTESKRKSGAIIRQHQFVLIYVDSVAKGKSLDLVYYNFSTNAAIKARIKHGEQKAEAAKNREAVAAKEPKNQIDEGRIEKHKKPDPPVSPAPVRINAEEKPKTEEGMIMLDNGLTISQQAFQDRAKDKTTKLSNYMVFILNKKKSLEAANIAINKAVALFINEDVLVEVSSLNNPKRDHYPVRKYLNRLRHIGYDSVWLEFTNVQYVGKLQKQPDGTYRGFVEFEQRFTGFKGDFKAYGDITRKTAEVVLRIDQYEKDGKKELTWNVYLSDITVITTSSF